uniref:Uncharacterized protein n=1 Tax=Meloidogyne enterolobii TaxID=390850 RepID=A0A6V7WUI0_MELEN|nr:unnamed protein product [Meloidogyne enterolobii]
MDRISNLKDDLEYKNKTDNDKFEFLTEQIKIIYGMLGDQKRKTEQMNETLQLVVKNVANLTKWVELIDFTVRKIEREIEIDSYCSYEIDFSQGKDAELTINKALGIGAIKAGSAWLGAIPVLGGAAAPIFDYGVDIGIKLAEKYCRSVKRSGGEWKFDDLLDTFDISCEDKEKFDRLMRNILYEAGKKALNPPGFEGIDMLADHYIPFYDSLKKGAKGAFKLVHREFRKDGNEVKEYIPEPCYNTTTLNLITYLSSIKL